jgi:hypothetical protein
MQAIGTKSVASFLTWIITAALFLSAVSGGIVILMVIVLMITSSESQDFLVSAWPVWVDRVQAPFALVAAHRNVSELALNVNQGTLHFASTGLGYYLLKLLDAVFNIGVVVVILALLRQIFATLAQNHPFTPENARKLRTIAILILLIAPYNLLKSLVYYLYITRHVSVSGGDFLYWSEWFRSASMEGKILIVPEVGIQPLLIGLVLLVIAELFRIGAELQTDKESII